MTPKAFLVGESVQALRAANAYDKVVSTFVKRSEIISHMLNLSDEELARATFLRSSVFIASA